jgi:organic radical activating enzyme
MNKFFDWINNLFKSTQPLPPGLYHYQTPPDADRQYRMHLRVSQDGTGLLIINASTILHLNQTATEYAYHLLKETNPEETSRIISSRYQIDRDQARSDYIEIRDKILSLLEIPDLDPVSFLDISRADPYSEATSTPYRLDCALTYRLPDSINPQAAPTKRVDRELTTQEWFTIIDRAWQAGVPHLIFTGGEPTLREDLIQILEKAEANGQVSGLISDGLKLKDKTYLNKILLSGLDHLLFLLSPELDPSWSALESVLNEDLHTTVHVTINQQNSSQMGEIIQRCKDLGANAISLSTADPEEKELSTALELAQNLVAEADLPLKWDLPVPYSAHNPISLELKSQEDHVQGAGKAWYYIEPDGDLLPAQGFNQVLGNMLTDDWSSTWDYSGKEI